MKQVINNSYTELKEKTIMSTNKNEEPEYV